MVARTDVMPTTPPSRFRPRHPMMPRWVGVVFPIVILAAIGFGLAYAVNRTIVPFALALAVSAGMGLLAGFTARWALRRRHPLIRLLAALAGLTIGLLLLGLLTSGETGIGFGAVPVSTPNLKGLIQLGIGTLTTVMALRAWRVRIRPAAEPTRPPKPTLARRGQALGRSLAARWQSTGLYRELESVGDRLRSLTKDRPARRPTDFKSRPAPRHSTETSPRSNRWREAVNAWAERLTPRGKAASSSERRSLIRMGQVAEQRCPYCFGIVQKDDPRGIVVCPICHTPHHADCWAVTGMCQIPHIHN